MTKTPKEIEAEKHLAVIGGVSRQHHISSYNKPGFKFELQVPEHLGVYAYAGNGEAPDRWSMQVGIYVPRSSDDPKQHPAGWYAYMGPIPEIAE